MQPPAIGINYQTIEKKWRKPAGDRNLREKGRALI